MAKEKGSVSVARGEEVAYPIEVTFPNVDGRGLDVTITLPSDLLNALKAIAGGEKGIGVCPATPKPDLTSRALAGEFEPLISHFESGGELTDKERHALAKIARGTLPRIGRPPESETEMRNRGIVRFAMALKEYGGKRVADVAARKFSIDRSYVSKLIGKYGAEERMLVVFLGGHLEMEGADNKTVRRVVLGYAGVNEDDLREATGRKQVRK
jgi:hypothetical protein